MGLKRSSAIGGLAFAGLLGAVAYGFVLTRLAPSEAGKPGGVEGPALNAVETPGAPAAANSGTTPHKPAPAPHASSVTPKPTTVPADRLPASAATDNAARPAATVSSEPIPVVAPPVATIPTVTPPVATPAVVTPVQAQLQAAQSVAIADTSSPPAASKPEKVTVKINKDAVIGISLDQTLNTETGHVEDRVSGRIVRDVVVDGHTAIPAGAKLEGTVTLVQRGQKKERGKLGVRFTTLVLDDNTRIAIQTDTIFRESDPVGQPSAAMNASSAVGVLLANGGRRGAPAGPPGAAPPSTGAYKPDVRVSSGSPLTVKLTAPLTITVIK